MLRIPWLGFYYLGGDGAEVIGGVGEGHGGDALFEVGPFEEAGGGEGEFANAGVGIVEGFDNHVGRRIGGHVAETVGDGDADLGIVVIGGFTEERDGLGATDKGSGVGGFGGLKRIGGFGDHLEVGDGVGTEGGEDGVIGFVFVDFGKNLLHCN